MAHVHLMSVVGDTVIQTNESASRQATRTHSLKSEASVVFALHESLEHVAAALGLGRHLGDEHK